MQASAFREKYAGAHGRETIHADTSVVLDDFDVLGTAVRPEKTETATQAFSEARSQRHLHIGMAEIVADKQQWHLQPMGQRVGKAIAEVQSARMAALAEALKRIGGGIDQLLIQGHQQDLRACGGRDGRLGRTAEVFHHRTGVDGQVDHQVALSCRDRHRHS